MTQPAAHNHSTATNAPGPTRCVECGLALVLGPNGEILFADRPATDVTELADALDRMPPPEPPLGGRLGSADTPVPVARSNGLAELLAHQPRFGACGECGQPTIGATCFDCQRKRDDARGVVEETIDSIPENFRVCRFGTPKLLECVHGNTSLLARAEASLGATRALFVGGSGTGKTSLAVAMMREWSRLNGKAALFALATDLATAKSRTQYGKESREIAEARAAPLLVIDDVGTDEFKAPASPVTETVFHRHAHALPTWVTTWMGSDPERRGVDTQAARRLVMERYGDGFARRLFEGVRIIDCSARAQ